MQGQIQSYSRSMGAASPIAPITLTRTLHLMGLHCSWPCDLRNSLMTRINDLLAGKIDWDHPDDITIFRKSSIRDHQLDPWCSKFQIHTYWSKAPRHISPFHLEPLFLVSSCPWRSRVKRLSNLIFSHPWIWRDLLRFLDIQNILKYTKISWLKKDP